MRKVRTYSFNKLAYSARTVSEDMGAQKIFNTCFSMRLTYPDLGLPMGTKGSSTSWPAAGRQATEDEVLYLVSSRLDTGLVQLLRESTHCTLEFWQYREYCAFPGTNTNIRVCQSCVPGSRKRHEHRRSRLSHATAAQHCVCLASSPNTRCRVCRKKRGIQGR